MTRKLSRPELESKWAVWNLPTFEGLPDEDPQAWLTSVDGGCENLGIPVSQRLLTAIHFLRGSLRVVMKAAKGHLESLVLSCIEKWDAFKAALNDLHERRRNGDEADYVQLAGSCLLLAGSSAILPSLGVLAINAVGFTSTGVAAGSLAATIQSIVYGASTGGLFSVFQSIGATALVAPPLAFGLGVAAIGTGLVCALSSQGRSSNTGRGGISDSGGGDDYDDNDFGDCDCSFCFKFDKVTRKPEKIS